MHARTQAHARELGCTTGLVTEQLPSFPWLTDSGSLQAWLESAWAQGFDAAGAESLGGRVQVGITPLGHTKGVGGRVRGRGGCEHGPA